MPEWSTVVDAIEGLRAQGFDGDFSAQATTVRCDACGGTLDPAKLEALQVARFEGESNPDDEAIVIGARCANCGSRGVLVAAYGPLASEPEASLLAKVRFR